MNPNALLALISDLYSQATAQAKQVDDLTAERDALRAELLSREKPPPEPPAAA